VIDCKTFAPYEIGLTHQVNPRNEASSQVASGLPAVLRSVPDWHLGDAADSERDKSDEINLRHQACRTTGSPPRRGVEISLPTFQSEPETLAKRSTRPTHCDVQLARLAPLRALRGNAVPLPPPKLALRVVSHPVRLEPSDPTPKSRSGPGRGDPGKEPIAVVRDALGTLHPTNRRPVESPTRPYPT